VFNEADIKCGKLLKLAQNPTQLPPVPKVFMLIIAAKTTTCNTNGMNISLKSLW